MTNRRTILLVRHGKAGSRQRWESPDHVRPLTAAGRRQADWLAGLDCVLDVRTILTSPYVRCVQTVEPLAARLGVPVAVDDRLAEGVAAEEALRALASAASGAVVACTHGDIVEGVLGVLAPGRKPKLAKGSVWVLHHGAAGLEVGTYLPPPKPSDLIGPSIGGTK